MNNATNSGGYLKKMGIALVLLLLVYLAYLGLEAGISGNNSGKENSPIKFGVVLPATGRFASISEDIYNALTLAKEKLGEEVEFIVEDSAAESQKGISAITNLIHNKKAQFILTGPGSTVNIAMAPIAEQSSIPYFAISSIPLIDKDDFTFTLQPAITGEISKIIEVARAKGFVKAAVVYDSASDSLTLGSGIFEKEFASKGGVITMKEGYGKDIQYNSIATKIIHSKSDFVYVLGADKAAGPVIKSLRDLGYKGPIAGFSGIESGEFLNITKGVNDNIILTSVPFSCDSSQTVKAYCDEYRTRFNREPQQYGAYSYDAVMQAVKAYGSCNVKSGTGLKDCILKYKSADTLTDSFGFDQMGDLSEEAQFLIKEIKNGEFVRVE